MKRKIEAALVYGVYGLLAAAAVLFLAEIGVRVLGLGERPDPLAGRPDMAAYSYFDWTDDFFADARRAGYGYAYDYEPFSLWKHRDFASATFNVENGHRVTWEPPSAEEATTIYAFGGSTLFGAEGPDEHTVASYLAKKLNRRGDTAVAPEARPATTFVVQNYAVSGFSSDNEVHLLVKLLAAGHRPDVVIFYDGVNDVYYKAYMDEPHYLYDTFSQLGTYSLRGLVSRAAGRLRLLKLLAGDPAPKTGIRDRAKLAEGMPAVVEGYLGNVELVRALAEGYGFEARFFWQTNLFVTGKELTAEELGLKERYEGYAPPYEAASAAVEDGELLVRSGIHDLRGVLDGVRESVFVDFCHVTAIGNEAVAEAVAETLGE